ncbi:hypothetical protein FGO68_gene14956 [Halteria grandinella]|uniref:Uncharacterized protein n=1 Tax=Halteria grandinella TaxID=5974 RepID=A0A8J8NPW4_HALGN|nr:hypothetical protein FGO68_gene14956 [Halteria grandinella]
MTRPSHAKIRLPEFYSVGSRMNSLIQCIEMNFQNTISLNDVHRILRNSCSEVNSYEDQPSSAVATQLLYDNAVFFEREQILQK